MNIAFNWQHIILPDQENTNAFNFIENMFWICWTSFENCDFWVYRWEQNVFEENCDWWWNVGLWWWGEKADLSSQRVEKNSQILMKLHWW